MALGCKLKVKVAPKYVLTHMYMSEYELNPVKAEDQ